MAKQDIYFSFTITKHWIVGVLAIDTNTIYVGDVKAERDYFVLIR